jgi:hypothetical protein
MNSTFLSRFALISLSSLILSACGGGGGSGGSGSGSSATDPVACLSQEFNRYLPLTEDTSINYDFNTTSGVVSCDVTLTDENGTDIYSIAYEFGMQPLTLYVSSTPSSITLYGIDGPIDIDIPTVGTRELDQIRFDEPVVLLNDGPAITNEEVSGTGKLGTANITLVLEYNKNETDTTYADNGVFGEGDLPARISELDLSIESVRYSGITFNLAAALHTQLTMAEGIGLVRHQHTAEGLTFSIASNISSVSGLPLPLWLDYVSPNAPSVVGNSYFTIDGTTVTDSDYSLVNAADISATGWLTIEADNAGIFQIITEYDAVLDTLTLPYSVQVIFENLSSGEQVSTSVTVND